ncbi:MAG: ABC transporter substrate-binding protein [Candidatus Binatia bacterium]
MTRCSHHAIRCLSSRLFWAASSLVIAVLVTCQSAHSAGPVNRVVIAYPSPTPRVAPLWLAQDLDFFGKYNLAAQIVLVRNNQMLAAGLGAGDIDVGYTGGTTVLGAAAAGVELRLIAGFVSHGRGYLVVRPDIKKPADLAGKRIGVQSIGGTLWMYVILTLEQLGLDTVRDNIRLLVIGDQIIIARALETQIVDAAVLTTRTYIPGLKQKGFSVLNEVTPAMAATGIVTRKTYLQKNPEILENIMKALIEAEHYMMSPGGKAQSIKTIMSHLKLTEIAVAEEGHADAIKDFDPKPVPSLDGLKNMQRLLAMQNPRLADVNPASLVDLTLMRKLEDSGFFTQLQTRYRE